MFEEEPDSHLHDRGVYHRFGMLGEKRGLILSLTVDIRFRPAGHLIPAFAGMTEKNSASFVTPAPIFIGINSSRSPVQRVSQKQSMSVQ